jgi:hypothetical protein
MIEVRLAAGGWRCIVAAGWLVLAASAFAQEEPPKPIPPLPMGDTLLSLPSPNLQPYGMWELKFSHRFNQSLSNGSFSDQVHSLFGLDTNADVVFGLSWALRRNLQLSIARSNTNDTLEAAAKYVVLRQAPKMPLSLTVRGGTDIRTERDRGDRTSFFAQAIVSHQFARKAEIFAIPTFATNAGRAVNGTGSGALFDTAFNIPVGVAYMLSQPVALVAEIIPPNGDLPSGMKADFGWAFGIKRTIGDHWFELMLTNNQATLVDQYVTTTFQGTPLDAGDVRLGFNIERRFGRRR